MQAGKDLRLERIFNAQSGKTIIVPMDHGTSLGPIPGLISPTDAVNKVCQGGANAVLMHKGLVRSAFRGHARDLGLIVHLSASTDLSPLPNAKRLVATVEEAVKMGADAVSVHVNLGDETESAMLADLGRVGYAAQEWGIPLLAMVYGRGPKIPNGMDPAVVAHCARVGEELGADVVKVPYCGDVESFARVCEGCSIPVVIAGGPKMDTRDDILRMVYESILAGGAGISIGRNVFQDPDPASLVHALSAIIHHGEGLQQARTMLAA
ncbi:MAG: 2-amino-3,7-dideoxy-D-threo-hept-6-ulosonate synthase [Desulfoplanes sp.]|jgi:class I fructose-bisphosphate aldolase|nr:2-amino-3,7-dideoxy-D-threo-hept-6-ulosonate synthase [Desulfoplanes sp.]